MAYSDVAYPQQALSCAARMEALRREGNEHSVRGRPERAIDSFRAAVELYLAERPIGEEAIEIFVQVAGNLCGCYHKQGEFSTCVITALEVLGVYPVIPRAYGALGMCIIDRLVEQHRLREEHYRQEQQHLDELSPPSHNIEAQRSDPLRYVVKLAGVVCTVDEAHMFLCRAVLLSRGALQVLLGPYIGMAVRFMSEQLLWAGPTLERNQEHEKMLLERLCPLEAPLPPPPLTLTTVETEARIRAFATCKSGLRAGPAQVAPSASDLPVLDGATRSALSPPDSTLAYYPCPSLSPIPALPTPQHTPPPGTQEEAASVAANDLDEEAATPVIASPTLSQSPLLSVPLQQPTDFMLSAKCQPVRVCHSERGGVPRGVTIARAATPFAVCLWARRSNGVAGGGAASCSSALAGAATGLGGAPRAMPLPACCVACGRDIDAMTARRGGGVMGCVTCGAVVYCSATCANLYRERHDRYECVMYSVLDRAMRSNAGGNPPGVARHCPDCAADVTATASTAAATMATSDATSPGGSDSIGDGHAGDDGCWGAVRMMSRVVPLCIALYSGIRCHAHGWERVVGQLERGVRHELTQRIPRCVRAVLRDLASHVDDLSWLEQGAGGTAGRTTHETSYKLLRVLLLIARLMATHDDTHRATLFFSEKLLLRHSCEPNCCWMVNQHAILTSRFVRKGEELTMAVDEGFPQHWPLRLRRRWLDEVHGFECACTRCQREARAAVVVGAAPCCVTAPDAADRGSATSGEDDMMASRDMTERLLNGVRLHQPVMTEGDGQPARHLHAVVQRAIEQSAATPGAAESAAQTCSMRTLQQEMSVHLLPTHYLMEDMRQILCKIGCGESGETTALTECKESLLFHESMWPGATPAKVRLVRALPAVFEGTRHVHPMLSRRRRGSNAGMTSFTPEEAEPSSTTTPPQLMTSSTTATTEWLGTCDFTQGTPIDHFYGSYVAWYS